MKFYSLEITDVQAEIIKTACQQMNVSHWAIVQDIIRAIDEGMHNGGDLQPHGNLPMPVLKEIELDDFK